MYIEVNGDIECMMDVKVKYKTCDTSRLILYIYGNTRIVLLFTFIYIYMFTTCFISVHCREVTLSCGFCNARDDSNFLYDVVQCFTFLYKYLHYYTQKARYIQRLLQRPLNPTRFLIKLRITRRSYTA